MAQTHKYLYQNWPGSNILDLTETLLLSQHNAAKRIQKFGDVDIYIGLISLQMAANGTNGRPRSLRYNSNCHCIRLTVSRF